MLESQICAKEFLLPYPRPKPPAGGTKANYPGFITPALATSISKVPSGERWIHEVKFDGYRVQMHVVNETIQIFTRPGNDWTNRFKKIAADGWQLNAKSAIIDGEVIVPAANGVSDFLVLQMSCAANRTSSCCTHSICSISTATICAKRRCSNGRPLFAR